MKRKKNFVLACLMMIVILSACGTKREVETTSTAVNDTTQAVETEEEVETTSTAVNDKTQAVETEEEVEVEETEETVADGGMVDVVIGKDIKVKDGSIHDVPVSYTTFPEMHMLMLSDSMVESEDTEKRNRQNYAVYCPEIDADLYFSIYLNGDLDEYCAARHEETVSYGRYLIDYNWCQIAIKDTESKLAIVMYFYYDAKNAADAREPIEKWVDANIEYLKEQISGWDEGFVNTPAEDVSESTEEPIYSDFEDIGPLRFVHDNGYAEITVNHFVGPGDLNITASDNEGNEYAFPLEVAGESYYLAMDGDVVALHLTIEDGKINCYTEDMKYANLSGDYTLVE